MTTKNSVNVPIKIMGPSIEHQTILQTEENVKSNKKIRRKKKTSSRKSERAESEVSNYSSSEVLIAPANNQSNMNTIKHSIIEDIVSPENKENRRNFNSAHRHESSVCDDLNSNNLFYHRSQAAEVQNASRLNSESSRKPPKAVEKRRSSKAVNAKLATIDPPNDNFLSRAAESNLNSDTKPKDTKFYMSKEDMDSVSHQIEDYIKSDSRPKRRSSSRRSSKRSKSRRIDLNSLVKMYPSISNSHRMDMLKTAVGKSQGVVNLRIIRKKAGFLGMYPIYYLFDDTQSVFFLNSKKMTRNKTSNYLISCEKDIFNKDHDSYVGKLRSNNDKSKYLLYDNGESIEKNKAAGIDKIRCELAYVAYNIEKVNINGTRNVMVALPKLDEEYHPMVFRQLKKEDSICFHYADGKKENLYTFENAMPYWKNNKYVLNFSERIKKSSVKNLQIIRTRKTKDGESKTDIVLEFGKVSSNEFSLTLKYPFSIMNAFAVALSSFDK